VAKDSLNAFAQLTLGEASLMSGQLDKAAERFTIVTSLQPANLQANLLLADTYERMNKKSEAITAYQKSLPLVANPAIKKEIEKRVSDLKNNK
ncbi:MAG TPA: tetratricopeptide repeat protein, partial [Flavisolibacter sp.]|nr:tetratricopeptide repeat protein [Flavisolibacter sp.]